MQRSCDTISLGWGVPLVSQEPSRERTDGMGQPCKLRPAQLGDWAPCRPASRGSGRTRPSACAPHRASVGRSLRPTWLWTLLCVASVGVGAAVRVRATRQPVTMKSGLKSVGQRSVRRRHYNQYLVPTHAQPTDTGCPRRETPWSVCMFLTDCMVPTGARPMSRLRRPLLPVTG